MQGIILHEEDFVWMNNITKMTEALRLEDDEIDLREGSEKGNEFGVVLLVADIDDELPLGILCGDRADGAEEGARYAVAIFDPQHAIPFPF